MSSQVPDGMKDNPKKYLLAFIPQVRESCDEAERIVKGHEDDPKKVERVLHVMIRPRDSRCVSGVPNSPRIGAEI